MISCGNVRLAGFLAVTLCLAGPSAWAQAVDKSSYDSCTYVFKDANQVLSQISVNGCESACVGTVQCHKKGDPVTTLSSFSVACSGCPTNALTCFQTSVPIDLNPSMAADSHTHVQTNPAPQVPVSCQFSPKSPPFSFILKSSGSGGDSPAAGNAAQNPQCKVCFGQAQCNGDPAMSSCLSAKPGAKPTVGDPCPGANDCGSDDDRIKITEKKQSDLAQPTGASPQKSSGSAPNGMGN